MTTSDKTVELAIIYFVLPDGRIVLQRKDEHSPYAPGKLGFFGGHIEKGETADACLIREIAEETSLDYEQLHIQNLGQINVPASQDFPSNRRFHLFKSRIESSDFEVYEGAGSEAYTLEELRKRNDLSGAANIILSKKHEGVMKWR